jgi:uncharacterized membrane protein YhaH (DUF805 family)
VITAKPRPRGFLGEVLFALAGLLIWAAHFLLVYGATALLCARGAGAAVALLTIAVATVVALAALLAVLAVAHRRKQGLDSTGRHLLAALATFGAVIALVAVIWEALAGAFLPSC